MPAEQIFTVPALVHGAAREFGDSPAVGDGRTTLGFAGLADAAVAAAAALRGLGVARGDRVGVCTAKSVDQVVAVLGVLLADAVLVPILPTLRPENIRHIVVDSGMRLAVTDRARCDELREAAPELALVFAGEVSPAVPEAAVLPDPRAGRGDAPEPPPRTIGEDLAAVIYSSGSTGRPKGIMLSHRNLWHGAHITARYLGTVREDRIGSVLSLNFDYGLNQLWQTLLTGARLYLHELVFPKDVFQLVAREGITVLPVMPVILTRLFDRRLLRTRPDPGELSSVRCVSTSGGPVSDTMIADVTSTFPAAHLYLMYGLTEAFRSSYLEPEQVHARPRSIGRAVPDVELLVLDDELNEVGPGARGELVHRGGCVSKGYWNAPEETARRFRTIPRYPGETVVFSGDIVTRDEEGYLYFVGRRDAMIKTAGFRVSPTEVEDVAVRYPGVQACVAVGVPNVEIGADVALAWNGDDDVDEKAFAAFLRSGLPRHMVPRYLLRTDTFPSTGNQGKIDRPAVTRTVLDRVGGVCPGG